LLSFTNESTLPGGHKSRLTDLTLVMCTPNALCYPKKLSLSVTRTSQANEDAERDTCPSGCFAAAISTVHVLGHFE
jgi:hypothetical protein